MITPPPFESARRRDFENELRTRARVWLPEWQPRGAGADLAGALFGIAARLEGEVAQRLDRTPEKNFRGLLHWLGIRGEAGRAARVPVVFQMTPGADAVRVALGAQVQAQGLDEPVVFETTTPMTITPAAVTALFAGDPGMDAYFAAPPGLLAIDVPQGQQNDWRVVSDAPAGNRTLQLEPATGLAKDLVIETNEATPRQFRVLDAKDGLCSIDPAIGDVQDSVSGALQTTGAALATGVTVRRVTEFAPFTPAVRDRQQHVVYVGAKKAFDIEAEAAISLDGWEFLDTGFDWAFWGKKNDADKPAWIPMKWETTKSGDRVLRKPAGKIEEVEVNKVKNRWLRGLRKSLRLDGTAKSLPSLQMFINCDPAETSPPVAIEAIANSTPLVLNTGFHPLGREPRVFDAFYLGSREAFSKARAGVTARFTMGDEWGSPLAAAADSVRGLHVVFAIGTDNALRIVQINEVANASNVAFHISETPRDANLRPLKLRAESRPGVCRLGGITYASAFAGSDVWLWSSEDARFPEGSWRSLGKPGTDTADDTDRLETVLVRNAADSALIVYALFKGKLYRKDSAGNGPWELQDVDVADPDHPLVRVVPLTDLSTDAGSARDQDGLLGVDDLGRLYQRDGANNWTDVTPPSMNVDFHIYPVFARTVGAADLRVIAARKTPSSDPTHWLLEFDPADHTNPFDLSEEVQLQGTAMDVIARGAHAVAVFTAINGDVAGPALWDGESADARVLRLDPPEGTSKLLQSPVRAGARLLFPGERGTLRVIAYDTSLHDEISNVDVKTAAVLPASANLVDTESYRVDLTPGAPNDKTIVEVVTFSPLEGSGYAVILDDAGHTQRESTAIALYRDVRSTLYQGQRAAQGKLDLEAGDTDTAQGVTLFLSWNDGTDDHERLVSVVSKTATTATLSTPIPTGANNVAYVPVDSRMDLTAVLRPAIDVDKKFGVSNATFTFPDLLPTHQTLMRSTPDLAGNRRWVVLAEPWTLAPTAPTDLIADALDIGSIEAQPPRASNPALSWEYWDGNSWWKLEGVLDGTDSLVRSGDVRFCVPANAAETEVAGRKNFWIRARLVGGDYGQESVKLTTDTVNNVQTVTRSTENIRAPFVNKVEVTYKLCCPIAPDHVLSEDGGEFVDHSDANREPGAHISAFIPLATTGDERAVYLGFDAAPGAQSMSLLFVLDERPHADAFPLRAEMLRATGFEAIDCQDGTRGLSETGIVTLQFEAPPVKVGMFGKDQHWVRLLPRAGFDASNWSPVIRGAYANAAIAEAHETQRNELLGSSDGRPGLRVTVARTPVIEGKLVLRVRERLSPEDVEALRSQGADRVIENLGDRPGFWVLWKEEQDLLGSGPADRVFTFEDDTGDITFGDGQNGMIPPIGRDSIAAQSYQRGGGETANKVTRRTAASLITPLQGVERAAFAGESSGGSNPDDASRTLRFAPDRLGRRQRLLTLADLERAALEFSVDVAQAFARRKAGVVEVFLVMRGADPLPSADKRRGLLRYLSALVSPDLATPGAIVVRRPEILPIRVNVGARVVDLADADQVRDDCAKRIRSLLDPNDGGFDGQGWRLGVAPGETDIAARLEDIANLAELVSVRIETATTPAGVPQPRESQLVSLADDGIRIEIDPVAQGVAA